MKHLITGVDKDSIAEELGVKSGYKLCSINGEEVVDVIDYEHLSTNEQLLITFETDDGKTFEAEVEKDLYEPLGLNFEKGLMDGIRSCRNRCVFCFIDQMPKNVRTSLKVKDDDWRLSFIMGNYITLTNVDDEEFERIIKRKAGPLYVSVHATDPEVRKRMMTNKTADRIMPRLQRLYDENIKFNCQIVLCPELNDGDILKRTIEDLISFYPVSQSLAVVPVGLTKFRQGLFPLRCLTKAEAATAIDMIESYQNKMREEYGEGFAYASDELYIIADRELPKYEMYDDFPQIENGVGLLRKFENEFIFALKSKKPLEKPVYYESISGVSAAPFMANVFKRLEEYNIFINVNPIRNSFFGETVTVTGLICACDIISNIKGKIGNKKLLIPRNMMKEQEEIFLDGVTQSELEKELGTSIISLSPNDGEEFINKLFSMR